MNDMFLHTLITSLGCFFILVFVYFEVDNRLVYYGVFTNHGKFGILFYKEEGVPTPSVLYLAILAIIFTGIL